MCCQVEGTALECFKTLDVILNRVHDVQVLPGVAALDEK